MAVHVPPTSYICLEAQGLLILLCSVFDFFYNADVSRSSPRPSGKLAAVIRFDMREDRKYKEEQKQGTL